MTLIGDALALARKDLVAGVRARDGLPSAITLGATALVLVALALGPDVERLRLLAPALVGVVLAFATVSFADRLDAIDRADDAIVALWLALDDPRAIFVGRVCSLTASLAVLELGLWASAALLLDLPVTAALLVLVPVTVMTSVSGASVAALVMSMVGGSRHRVLLAPTLLLPMLVPTLLAGVQAATAALAGQGPIAQWAGVAAAETLVVVGVGLLTYREAARP
ncbi:MAG: heme exporter protein CcmB [Candidatus Limnocylindrales bacterium]